MHTQNLTDNGDHRIDHCYWKIHDNHNRDVIQHDLLMVGLKLHS